MQYLYLGFESESESKSLGALSAWLSRINAFFMLIQSIGLIESNVLTTQRASNGAFWGLLSSSSCLVLCLVRRLSPSYKLSLGHNKFYAICIKLYMAFKSCLGLVNTPHIYPPPLGSAGRLDGWMVGPGFILSPICPIPIPFQLLTSPVNSSVTNAGNRIQFVILMNSWAKLKHPFVCPAGCCCCYCYCCCYSCIASYFYSPYLVWYSCYMAPPIYMYSFGWLLLILLVISILILIVLAFLFQQLLLAYLARFSPHLCFDLALSFVGCSRSRSRSRSRPAPALLVSLG